MKTFIKKIGRFSGFLILVGLISSCAQNSPHRDGEPTECSDDLITNPNADKNNSICSKSYIEKYNNFDLTFFEFSERGNVFNADSRVEKTLDYIRDKASTSENGIAMIVFVHGWKHNANTTDKNVVSFRKTLRQLSSSQALGNKDVIGVYIGWRGLSFHGLGVFEQTTFWDRKAAAEEIGRGGVTSLLVKLNKIDKEVSLDKSSIAKNIMVTVGHSFGGAIVLSALHDIILEQLITDDDQTYGGDNDAANAWIGDSIVLLNPAIEANQILPMKEASMEAGYTASKNQHTYMHVISSEGDFATRKLFPIGQYLDTVLTWNQETLERSYFPYVLTDGDIVKGSTPIEYKLKESSLDVNTVGNYLPILTGRIIDNGNDVSCERLKSEWAMPMPAENFHIWKYESYCGVTDLSSKHLPCSENEPVSFTTVPRSFIQNHNEIFNSQVNAYIYTILSQELGMKGSFSDIFNYAYCDIKEHEI